MSSLVKGIIPGLGPGKKVEGPAAPINEDTGSGGHGQDNQSQQRAPTPGEQYMRPEVPQESNQEEDFKTKKEQNQEWRQRQTEERVGELEKAGLAEGRIVRYLTPNTWRRKRVHLPAIVVFCYRDSQGRPTGTCNLVVFLNGPADTGDMLGPKARTVQFEPGVKFGEKQGEWSWLK